MTVPELPAEVETLVIGAGLSGLVTAVGLAEAGEDWHLLEARDRIGGRVLSLPGSPGDPARYDMGPAWIWPHNTRLLERAEALGLRVFPQHAEGRLVFEAADGAIRRDIDMAPMAGSLRIEGGIGALTEALARQVGAARLHPGHKVIGIARSTTGVKITSERPEGPFEISARRVILAMPPRLIAARIRFEPALPAALTASFAAIPTWMAGHAKLIAVYDRPFWRDMGLSGDAISHRGPLAEIHDASPVDGPGGALFGFFGVPATRRSGADGQLKDAALAQLGALFGDAARTPRAVMFHDWAFDPETATTADLAPLAGHPAYGPPTALAQWTDPAIRFAGTELAAEEGGFLEGAVRAAEAVLGS